MGKLPDNSASRDKLAEEISKLEQVAVGVTKPTLPEVKLEEMEYTPPSDYELSKKAEAEMDEYRRQQTAAIKENNAAEKKALGQKREGYETARDTDLGNLDGNYYRASQRIDDDVLKRGLARSSIAVNAKSGLESEYAARIADVQSAYGKQIAEIDAEIAGLDKKLTTALNDFNLSYAVKLSDRLDSLIAERDKKVAEVTKYNNEIRSKQAELDAERLKTESALYTQALNNRGKETDLTKLTPDERDAVYKAVFERMDAFLSSLSKEQAKLEVRNHTLYRNHLSDYYYYKLYDKYGR